MRRIWLVPVIIVVLFFALRPQQAGQRFPAGNAPTPSQPARMTTAAQAPPITPTEPQSDAYPNPTAPALEPEQASPTAFGVTPILPTPPPPINQVATPTSTPAAPNDLPPIPTLGATDVPELEPETAPPTAVVVPSATYGASQPTRLMIPDIALDFKPVAVGVDEERIPIVPRHDVGWFLNGAMPGQGSNIIFWGHVLRWKDSPNIPAPFARVHELKSGAQLIVITADGSQHRYHVTQQLQVRPEDVQYIYPTVGERVTLVSCNGDMVIQDGIVTKEFRLVTIAEPDR